MWSIETGETFPLSSVKPFEGLMPYRRRCLQETRKACQGGTSRRERSPVSGTRLEPLGSVEGFEYLGCPESGSFFLADLPVSAEWARLLSLVSRHRQSNKTFHADVAQTRAEHVYSPKLEWIQSALRMQGLERPSLLEVVTPPSAITPLLSSCGAFSDVTTVNEMELVMAQSAAGCERAGAAVLFESLDRVDDPVALLAAVRDRLGSGGVIFVTALVSTGFDVAVLGLNNMYLYPPDRTNCFSLQGLEELLRRAGFTLLEVSTPGVLDVEIVRTHLQHDPSLPLSGFDRKLLGADQQTLEAFQTFLQQNRMSSFARIVGRRR